jgi:hypothetical protein
VGAAFPLPASVDRSGGAGQVEQHADALADDDAPDDKPPGTAEVRDDSPEPPGTAEVRDDSPGKD